MPSPQKYGLRVALRPSNAMEAITYMDEKAVRAEVDQARLEGRDARFDCVNGGSDDHITVLVWAPDIQLIMHHKWERQAQPQVAIPKIVQ